jgi:hypothetical protein
MRADARALAKIVSDVEAQDILAQTLGRLLREVLTMCLAQCGEPAPQSAREIYTVLGADDLTLAIAAALEDSNLDAITRAILFRFRQTVLEKRKLPAHRPGGTAAQQRWCAAALQNFGMTREQAVEELSRLYGTPREKVLAALRDKPGRRKKRKKKGVSVGK